MNKWADRALHGILLGDCLGLPFEGLSSKQIKTLDPDLFHPVWLHERWVFSDDTEHAAFTLRALEHAQDRFGEFMRFLRHEFRWWILSLPFGGGRATLKAAILNLFFLPQTSVQSQGNGPMMRAPIIGAFFKDDAALRQDFVKGSTVLTHHDPIAIEAAWWVAEVAASCAKHPDQSPKCHLEQARKMLRRPECVDAFQRGLETASNVSPKNSRPGWCIESITLLTHIFSRSNGSVQDAIRLAVALGGDTDTHAAIVSSWCFCLSKQQETALSRPLPNPTISPVVLLFSRSLQLALFLPWMLRRRLPFRL